tara:strand:+ start:247 stop:477 length:231 start_codon:yes stop_codon:yes gene_type:complete
MKSFELNICSDNGLTMPQLFMSCSIKAENYDDALKFAKVKVKEMQKDQTRAWKQNQSDLGLPLPKPKLYIGKLENE